MIREAADSDGSPLSLTGDRRSAEIVRNLESVLGDQRKPRNFTSFKVWKFTLALSDLSSPMGKSPWVRSRLASLDPSSSGRGTNSQPRGGCGLCTIGTSVMIFTALSSDSALGFPEGRNWDILLRCTNAGAAMCSAAQLICRAIAIAAVGSASSRKVTDSDSEKSCRNILTVLANRILAGTG